MDRAIWHVDSDRWEYASGHQYASNIRQRLSHERLDKFCCSSANQISVGRFRWWYRFASEPEYRRALCRVGLSGRFGGWFNDAEAGEIPDVDDLELQWRELHADAASESARRRHKLAHAETGLLRKPDISYLRRNG